MDKVQVRLTAEQMDDIADALEYSSEYTGDTESQARMTKLRIWLRYRREKALGERW